MFDSVKSLFSKPSVSTELPSPLLVKFNDYYVTTKPTPQNAVDIFKGEWSSSFPEPFADLKAGGIPLFDDVRIHWLDSEIQGFEGKTVLELGPLEGAHSYLMERLGAKHVVSVEANTRAYLKCLIAKEVLGMARVKFLCGDFMEFLRDDDCPQVDICVASGVLYHMRNPAELIGLLAQRCTSQLFLWTHYYDAEAVTSHQWQSRFPSSRQAEYAGFKHTLYCQEYGEALQWGGFCGGTAEQSNWLSRGDIIRCLQHFGFGEQKISFDVYDHPNGPSFAIVAGRK